MTVPVIPAIQNLDIDGRAKVRDGRETQPASRWPVRFAIEPRGDLARLWVFPSRPDGEPLYCDGTAVAVGDADVMFFAAERRWRTGTPPAELEETRDANPA